MPHVPDARDEPLVEERLAELARWSAARSRATIAVEVGRLGEDVRAEPPRRAVGELEHRAAAEHRLPLAPASTSHGRPGVSSPRGTTRQLPFMRRWLRRTTPPSKRSRRFLPRASTDSSTRPSSRSATPVARARGCGLDVQRLADEHLEPQRRAVQGVSLGHRED